MRPHILFIHGRGSSPEDMRNLAGALDLPAEIEAVFPRAPIAVGNGFTWYSRPYTDLSTENRAEFERARELLRAQLRAIQDSGTPPERIAVAGFSQGGVLALDLAVHYPARLAGAVVLSGGLHDPAAAEAKLAAGEQSTPILMMHGTNDSLIPVEAAREQADLLRSLGANLTFREFPIDHTVSREELAAARSFLLDVLNVEG